MNSKLPMRQTDRRLFFARNVTNKKFIDCITSQQVYKSDNTFLFLQGFKES